MSFEDKQHVCSDCWVVATAAERERIIKLLEEMPWQIYSGVGIDGKPIESVWTPKVLIREDAIALIKGENK